MPKVVPEYKEDAKRRIIEAAIDVIAERGCDRMTFDDVAKKLGVTKGAIYWYFANKEELIIAVMSAIQSELQRVSFDSYYNRSAEETLLQIFDRFSLTDSKKREVFFEMFALANRNSKIRHAILEYYRGMVSTFEEAIARERKRNPAQARTDARKLAILFTALFSGLMNYRLVWLYENEIRDLWIEGIRNLLNPSGTEDQDKNSGTS